VVVEVVVVVVDDGRVGSGACGSARGGRMTEQLRWMHRRGLAMRSIAFSPSITAESLGDLAMNLGMCIGLSDAVLNALVASACAPHLIPQPSKMQSTLGRGLKRVFASCSSLRALELNGCSMTDFAVAQAWNILPWSCRKVSDSGAVLLKGLSSSIRSAIA
jgi:hypothetical protein